MAQPAKTASSSSEVTQGTVGWESFQMQIRYRYCRCPIHKILDSDSFPHDFRFSMFQNDRDRYKVKGHMLISFR